MLEYSWNWQIYFRPGLISWIDLLKNHQFIELGVEAEINIEQLAKSTRLHETCFLLLRLRGVKISVHCLANRGLKSNQTVVRHLLNSLYCYIRRNSILSVLVWNVPRVRVFCSPIVIQTYWDVTWGLNLGSQIQISSYALYLLLKQNTSYTTCYILQWRVPGTFTCL